MITVSAAYAAENAKATRTPQYRVRFANVSSPPEQNYVTHKIVGDSSAHQYLQVPRGFAAQVVPERGTTSTGTLTFVVEDDAAQIVTGLVVTGIDGTVVHVDMGFDAIDLADWVVDAFVGVVDNVRMTDDQTGYEVTLAAIDTLTNKTVFQVSSTTSTIAINSSAATLNITDASGFLSPSGAFRQDSEIISYSGVTATGIQPQLYSWSKVIWIGDRFVAVGQVGSGSSAGIVAVSYDGKNWYRGTLPTGMGGLNGVAYSSSLGMLVAVRNLGGGTTTCTITSTNGGFTWTAQTTPFSSYFATAWSEDLGLFVVANASGSDWATSADGVTWTARTGSGSGAHAIIWASSISLFISVTGSTGKAASSPDGIVWTDRTAINSNLYTGLAWSGSKAIAVSTGGDIMATTDGINWSSETAVEGNFFEDVCYSSALGLFILVSLNGTHRVQTSTGGGAWVARTQAANNRWTCVAAGTSIVVALNDAITSGTSDNNAAMASADAVTWTVYESKLTGLTRGVYGTTAAAHAAGAAVNELIHYGPSHPMDILTGVLENTDKTGASVSSAYVDAAQIAAIKASLGSTRQMEFWIAAADNLAAWLAREIYQPLGLYPVTRSGKYSVYKTVDTSSSPPPSYVDAITDDVICVDENTGKPLLLTFDTNFKNSVFNSITFLYDYDLIANKFMSSLTIPSAAYPNAAATASIAAYGTYPMTVMSIGLRAALPGTADMLSTMAATFLNRHHNGMAAVSVRTFLRKSLLEGGDIVLVTSKLTPNPATKARGITGSLMEISSRSIAWADAHVDFNLLWPNWR